MKNSDLARFYPIGEIRQMIKDGTVSDLDLIDMSSYNANLFAYVHLKLPSDFGGRLSPMQERILDSFYNPENHYKELLLVCGRKSGKSMMSSILLLFEVYKMLTLIDDPHVYFGGPSTKQIFFQLLASNREQAQSIGFDYIRSFASTSHYLNSMITNQTNESLSFEKGLCVQVYNSSARSVRGESTAMVIFDEIAHWIFEKSNLSAESIYEAVMPNLQILKHMGEQAQSKSVLISSPAGRNGIFYDLFRRGRHEYVEYEHTIEAGEQPWRACWQVPTWKMNNRQQFKCVSCPDADTAKCITCISADLRQHWKRSPEKFMQEYGAEFIDTQDAALPKESIMACVSDRIFTNVYVQEKDIPRIISLDPALTGDQYALAMMHLEQNDDIIVDLIKVWQGTRDCPIQLNQVEEYLEKLYNNFYITNIILDQYQSASTVQSLQNKGIPATLIPTTTKSNMDAYDRLIKRINARTIHYPNHPTLINELAFLQRKVSGKAVKYEAAINSTDDISDAIAKGVMVLERDSNRHFTMERL
jgi:hypothetical protein